MSILGQERASGYREGWSQASQLCRDDAEHEGRMDEYRRWIRRLPGIRFRWFMFGVVATVGTLWALAA